MFENFSVYEDLNVGSPKSLENVFSRDKHTKLAFLANQINTASELGGKIVMVEQSTLRIQCHPTLDRFELDSVKSLQFSDSQKISSVHSINVDFVDLSRLKDLSAINALFKDIKILNPQSRIVGLDFFDIQNKSKINMNQNLKVLKQCPMAWVSDKKIQTHTDIFRAEKNTLVDYHRMAHKNGINTQVCLQVEEKACLQSYQEYLHQLKELNSVTQGIVSVELFSRSPLTEASSVLTILSLARLILSDIPEVSVSTDNIGPEIAQLSLISGANTICENIKTQQKLFQPYFSGQKIIKKTGKIIFEGHKQEICGIETPQKIDKILSELIFQVRDQLVLNKTSSDVLEQAINFSDYYNMLNLIGNVDQINHGSLAPVIDFQLRDLRKYSSFSCYRDHLLKNLLADSNDLRWLPINVDLAGVNKSSKELSLDDLYSVLAQINEMSPSSTLMVSGIRGFWRLVQEAKKSLGEAFQNISSLGVTCFQSSRYEAEGGLTLSELRNLHYAAHEHRLCTVPKVELVVPPWGGTPMWASFVHRLLTFVILSNENHSIPGISIELSRDSFISIVDYLKAITLAKLICPKNISVISNIYRTPLMAKYPAEIKSSGSLHPTLSFLALKSGADDLGILPSHRWDYRWVQGFFADQGMNISLRGSGFDMIGEPEQIKFQ